MLLLCNRIYPWICIPKDKYTSISRVYKTAPASKHDTEYFAQFINKTASPIYFKNYIYSWIYVGACACMLMCAIVYLYEGQRTTCENRFSYYVGPQKIRSLLGWWQVAHLAEVSCQPLLLLPAYTLYIYLSGVRVALHVYEDRRTISRVSAFLLSCGLWELNSSHQAWRQTPQPTGLSC